ncbi:hypothetical protein Tco_0971957 [Tanacetum coccineum]
MSVRPHTLPSSSVKARFAEFASAPTPPLPPPSTLTLLSSQLPQIPSPPLPLPSPPTHTSPTYAEAPLGYRAAGIRLRAASPPLFITNLLDLGMIFTRPDLTALEDLCLTAPLILEVWLWDLWRIVGIQVGDMEEEARPLPLPLPSPPTHTSPTYAEAPLGYRAAGIRLRAASPPLLLPSADIGDSSEAAAARQPGLEITHATDTVDATTRRLVSREVGYRIEDVWDDMVGDMEERAPTTVEGLSQRVKDLSTTLARDTHEIYV